MEYNLPANAVLDLGGHTLTLPDKYAAVFQGENAVIRNGTVTISSNADYALWIGNGSSDTNIFSGAGNGGDGITLYVAESVLSLPANLFFVIGAASLHPNLTAIEIAENSRLEEIGEGAFKECLKLKEVSLPASVKKICAEAFYGCSALVKAVVPSAADIDGTAFEDVSKKFELVIF